MTLEAETKRIDIIKKGPKRGPLDTKAYRETLSMPGEEKRPSINVGVRWICGGGLQATMG